MLVTLQGQTEPMDIPIDRLEFRSSMQRAFGQASFFIPVGTLSAVGASVDADAGFTVTIAHPTLGTWRGVATEVAGNAAGVSVTAMELGCLTAIRTVRATGFYREFTAGMLARFAVADGLVPVGITHGTYTEGGPTIPLYQFTGQPVAQVLADLQEATGQEWHIDEQGRFNWTPVRGALYEPYLCAPGCVAGESYRGTAADRAVEVVARGSNGRTARATAGELAGSGPYLRQIQVTAPTTSQAGLQQVADRVLAAHRVPSRVYTASLRPGPSEATLTLSGNEITDATRRTDTAGDGRDPEGSMGVYRATTNLFRNGSAETNDNYSHANSDCTVESSTDVALFGSRSLKVTRVGTAVWTTTHSQRATDGGADDPSVYMPVTAGTAYVWSFFARPTFSGANFAAQFYWYTSANAFISVTTANGIGLGVANTWTRFYTSATAPPTAAKVFMLISPGTTGTNGDITYLDGLQFEAGTTPTPYVHTDGATATRAAARVQGAASYLGEVQGWFAGRYRMGWPSTSLPNAAPIAFEWNEGTASNQVTLYRSSTANWTVDARRNGTLTNVSQAATHALNDTVTLVAHWTNTQVNISVNGGAFTTVARGGTAGGTALPATFEIGSRGGSSLHINADVFAAAAGIGSLDTDAPAYLQTLLAREAPLSEYPARYGTTMVWRAETATVEARDATPAHHGDIREGDFIRLLFPSLKWSNDSAEVAVPLCRVLGRSASDRDDLVALDLQYIPPYDTDTTILAAARANPQHTVGAQHDLVRRVLAAGAGGMIDDPDLISMDAAKLKGQLAAQQIKSLGATQITGTIVQAQIGTDAVGTAQIAPAAVTPAELATDAVETAKVAALAITDAKINDVAASKITGTISTTQIGNTQVTNAKIAAGVETNKLQAAGTQSTVGAAGAASALPANPTGYYTVLAPDGVTEVVVPYFAKT
jgi:hypothetical protein